MKRLIFISLLLICSESSASTLAEIFGTPKDELKVGSIIFDSRPSTLCAIKHYNLNANDYAEHWIYKYDRQTWNIVREDEFQRQDAYDNMASRIEGYDCTEGKLFTTLVRTQIGEYDFKRNAFPIDPDTEKSFIQVDSKYFKLPSSILFTRNYTKSPDALPMERDKARNFIASRKDDVRHGTPAGNVNRMIYVRIYFHIVGKSQVMEPSKKYNTFPLSMELVKAFYYSDEEETKLLYTFDYRN